MSVFNVRWAQLDVARQMETVEFIEEFISLIADSGYNGLLLYLEDRIKTASYPYPAENEAYTPDEIRHLVSYAAERGVEIIPCVATLGHAERFLRHKELEYLSELQGDMKGRFGGDRKQTFCVTHPDFYRFIGTYLREVAGLFPGKWFHVGLDEFWDFNLCERCRAAMPTLADEEDMFIRHLRKIRDILAQCGKRILMWSDMFEYYPEAFRDVPRDVVMVDWQYGRDIRGYLGHMLDSDCEDRLAVNAANGFDTIVAPAEFLLSNARSYFRCADGKKGVLGGLLTSWERNDTFLYRILPTFVAAGLQMNGMDPDGAFDAMTVKLFGTDDAVFRAALKIALNIGFYRHFTGVREDALFTRNYYGMNVASAVSSSGARAILKTWQDKITAPLAKKCLDDLTDALWEKEIAWRGKLAAHDIFDNAFTPDRLRKFTAFRTEFEAFLEHMSRHWQVYHPSMTPNVIDEKKKDVLDSLARMEHRLAGGAWIKLTLTLPDYFGLENVTVEYRAQGKWITAASGIYKPNDEEAVYCRFIPLEHDIPETVDSLRISASGLGGIGICHAELFANGRLLVPRAVLDVRGHVASPECLLRNNTNFAWFGGHSTRYDYFTRCAAEQQHSVTLEMKAFSPDNIAMAR